jgi:hypothetical protein
MHPKFVYIYTIGDESPFMISTRLGREGYEGVVHLTPKLERWVSMSTSGDPKDNGAEMVAQLKRFVGGERPEEPENDTAYIVTGLDKEVASSPGTQQRFHEILRWHPDADVLERMK